MSFGGLVVGGAVSALIAILVTQGFTRVKAFADKGDTVITGFDKEGKPVTVRVRNDAIVGPQYDIVELDTGTTQLTKPDRADYSITNEQDTDKRVFAIGLIPDATFKTEGIIEIFLNGVRLFPITDPTQGYLTSVSGLNIPIPPSFGLKIKPREKLEVFVWNPSGNSAKVNFAVFVGDIA